ncbi:cellulose synthase subunit BcsC-related outer membrane protein [Candidatus Nitrotoga arctica]|uniref:Cellulose synthase operon protein C n=1 Tax=Candidatus Nitrotoga arctica TaxID=453162 RepID=A0ABN8AHR8_9PROT|nr:cellulose synthase subunit BcsC-related outer membrane protein [Candidatus Nitrotoga arctica]CAG9932266.1 Cellulose synthase operon protein C [Candidatus Nitrotoga arctica]
MQLRLIPLTFALTLAGLLSVPALARSENSASADLLRSAHMWEAKDRPDLARVMLEKLLTIESNPEVLFMLGSIELRTGNIKLAGEYLRRLEQRYPQHAKTLGLHSLYRVNTTEKQILANARLMARAGNTKEAAKIMRRLFPEAPPPGELGLEYYQLVSSTAADQQTAKSALDKLYRETGEARYRLAWLRLQSNQRSKQEILQGYESLAAAPDVNRQKLRENWWAAIKRLAAAPATLPWIRRYLKEFPNDQNAIEYLAELQQLHEKALRIANDPAVRARQTGIAFLEHDQLEAAQRELQNSLSKRPKDPQVLGSMGLLRLRQGHHEEAKSWFQRAAKAEPGSNKWSGLIRTATFWGQMKRADELLEAGKLAEAQQFARQALSIEPNNADGLALLGNILARSQNLSGAESLYREALKRDASNTSAMRGLLALLSRSERRDEAQALIAEFRQNNPKEANRFNESQASLLRDEAEAFISAHRPSHALLALETAVQLAPRDAWIRHDLANLYESLGLQILSRRVMAEGIALVPNDSGMNYAYALVLTTQEREIEALQRLVRIPPSARSSAMNELETRTWIKLRIRQATKLQADGRRDEATRVLLLAERHATDNNPNSIEQVSEGWFSLEQPARGLALMKRHLIDAKSATASSQLYYASLLNRAKQDDTLSIFLPELQQRPDWNDGQRETILAIETDLAARQIEHLLQRGEAAQARTIAARAAVSGRTGDLSTLKAQARLLLEANDWKAALLILQAILDKYPDDLESRLNLAQAHVQAGEKQAAQGVIDQLLPRLRENDVDTKLSITRLETRLGNMDRAKKIVTELLTSNPDNPDVLIQAGRIERSDQRYPAALAYFRQALILERRAPGTATTAESVPLLDLDPKHPMIGLAPQSGYALGYPNAVKNTDTADNQKSTPELEKTALIHRLTRAEEEITRIEARRDPRIEIGFEKLSRNSSNGTSTYHGTETPMVGWWPVGYDGHGFVHVDRVSVNAGELTQDDAPLFGKLGVRPSSLPPPFAQKVDGTSVGVGYEGDALRWDLGVIGIGFPVQNMVGGIRKGWEANKVDYALEIFRRPQTNSLLSYAGARDPATGEIWGGIAYTGVGGRLAHTFGQFNTFASAEYGLLRGKNVLNNNRLALRIGIDKDMLRREDKWVNLGLTLTHWRYKENESFYTFGHGGYYSPQSYTSVNLPVEWAGRSGKLSYLVRGSTSFAWTNEKRMPYYPTDSALQSDAVHSGNSIDPGFYPGGDGGGKGYSLRLATEYQVTPHLAIGGYYNMDRTAFYTPNLTFIYLRYLFKAHSEPVRFPPITARPYSRF